MSELLDRAKASLEDSKCTDEMQDLFRVGLVRELIEAVEFLEQAADHWKSLWQGTVKDSTKVIQERDEALREVEKLRRAVDVLKYDNRMGLDYE